MSDKDPRRLTQGRADALLEFFWTGVESERDSISELYGVKFLGDGTIDPVLPELSEPGDLDGLADRLEHLSSAIAAAIIIRRRYA